MTSHEVLSVSVCVQSSEEINRGRAWQEHQASAHTRAQSQYVFVNFRQSFKSLHAMRTAAVYAT